MNTIPALIWSLIIGIVTYLIIRKLLKKPTDKKVSRAFDDDFADEDEK